MDKILGLMRKEYVLLARIGELRAEQVRLQSVMSTGLHNRDAHGAFFDPKDISAMQEKVVRDLGEARNDLHDLQKELNELVPIPK